MRRNVMVCAATGLFACAAFVLWPRGLPLLETPSETETQTPAVFARSNIDGTWEAPLTRDGPRGPRTVTFVFTTQGSTLTGTISTTMAPTPVPVEEGRIEGSRISFKQTLRNGRGSSTFVYDGEVQGDEIVFTRQGGRGGGSEALTAKRVE